MDQRVNGSVIQVVHDSDCQAFEQLKAVTDVPALVFPVVVPVVSGCSSDGSSSGGDFSGSSQWFQ